MSAEWKWRFLPLFFCAAPSDFPQHTDAVCEGEWSNPHPAPRSVPSHGSTPEQYTIPRLERKQTPFAASCYTLITIYYRGLCEFILYPLRDGKPVEGWCDPGRFWKYWSWFRILDDVSWRILCLNESAPTNSCSHYGINSVFDINTYFVQKIILGAEIIFSPLLSWPCIRPEYNPTDLWNSEAHPGGINLWLLTGAFFFLVGEKTQQNCWK